MTLALVRAEVLYAWKGVALLITTPRGDCGPAQPLSGFYFREARYANTPQLWNATAFPLVLQSILGLMPLAPVETLVVDPVLPTWMPEVELRGLRVGEARVSLRFRRTEAGSTEWDVLHKRGALHVVRQPPPESLRAGWFDRLAGLFETSF